MVLHLLRYVFRLYAIQRACELVTEEGKELASPEGEARPAKRKGLLHWGHSHRLESCERRE